MNKNKIEIQLFKSPIGSSKKQKQILNSLGLKKNQKKPLNLGLFYPFFLS